MKLGLGLDVRKASAPAFKGLLDKFTGAVAAYSTRKLTASQPNILPADYGDGAAAAYSLRKVKASYSGNCIDVRRSSDNTTSSIGFSGNELDTTALEAFVNEDVDVYTSDFRVIGDPPVDQEDLNEANGTGAGGQSVADEDDAYKLTCDSTISFHSATTQSIFEVGQVYNVSFKYYIPSGQTIDGIRFIDWGISNQSTLDEWVTVNETNLTSTRTNIRFFAADGTSITPSTNVDGNVFYLKDIIITQTTADGFVTKWYDQSGNENDAVDATQETDNDQPQIVDAGSTILENGKPAIQFDGDDLLQKTSASIDIAEGASLFSVLSDYTSGAAFSANSGGSETSDEFLLWFSSSEQKFRYGRTPSGGVGVTETSGQQILTGIDDGDASISVFQNGTTTNSGTSTTTVSAVDLLTIGARGVSSLIYDGKIQELIFFNSDQSSNRQDIEWNINNHYNIYTDSWDKQSSMEVRRAIDNETTNIGFVGKDLDTTALETFASESSPVLDDYTGAAAAYSLRKVRSAYTGSAVRVRRSSDDGLQDIGFDANGDLDTTALTTFVNEDVDIYTSDFSSGIDGLIESRVTASSVDGISDGTTSKDDVLQSVLTSGSNTHYVYRNGTFDLSNTYDVSFEYYIPSVRPDGVTPQTIDGIVVRTGTGSDGAYPFSVLDSWQSETIQNWSPSTSNLLLIAAAVGEFIGSIDADGDVYYLKNIVITQTTADGAVTNWYDQSVPTETYDSDFSAGVDGFSATNPLNNTVTRLASVTDDYSTTVENVLQFEAATAGTNITQQLRNNLGLTVGSTYKVSFKMLIDSENETLVKAGLYDGSGTTPEDIVFGGKLTETGRWTTFTDVPITQENARLFFAGLDSSDNFSFDSTVGDKFYIADVSVDEVNDATQTTADNQPLVVSGGTLKTENGKAAIEFDDSDDNLDTSFVIGSTTDFSAFTIVNIKDLSSLKYIWDARDGSTDGLTIFADPFSGNPAIRARLNATTLTKYPLVSNTQYLLSTITNSTEFIFSTNGDTPLSGASSAINTTTNLRIGSASYVSSGVMDGKIQEIILFNSDQSSNRTGIEGNIGRYYNIDGFRDVFVSKWFDQSGNFNHAENSTSTEQPQIVDGGSVITEGTTPKAALDFDGSDDSFTANALSGLSRLDLFFATQTSDTIYVHFAEVGAIGSRGFTAQDGSTSSGLPTNMGTPTMYNNGTQFTGTTRDDVHTAQDGHQIISHIDTDTTAFSTFEIGGHGSFVFDGKFQELIAFDSDQSSNRTDIESNINKHFKIYE
jgi:hypothetical protein